MYSEWKRVKKSIILLIILINLSALVAGGFIGGTVEKSIVEAVILSAMPVLGCVVFSLTLYALFRDTLKKIEEYLHRYGGGSS